jgi:hypothetical protein
MLEKSLTYVLKKDWEPYKGALCLVDFSRTLSKAIRKLTTLTQDLKLVISAIATTVITEEACFCDTPSLTLSGSTSDHGLV